MNITTVSCEVNRKSFSELNWYCERTQKFCEEKQISLQGNANMNAKVLRGNANIFAREREGLRGNANIFARERKSFAREHKFEKNHFLPPKFLSLKGLRTLLIDNFFVLNKMYL